MQVSVNGVPTDTADAATVAVLIDQTRTTHRRVAVAVNGAVVPRSSWHTTVLEPGDAVEVLAPTAGG